MKKPIWGIGLAADDPNAVRPGNWRGKNWLGEVLMNVRQALRTQNELDTSKSTI